MLSDLLFELGTEELPSGAVWPLADALANGLVAGFKEANIQHGTVHRFATPRRLAVIIDDVSLKQPSQLVARRGPAMTASHQADGTPSMALLGFAKSCGVTVADLSPLKTDKGAWWIYEAEREGAHTSDLLPSLINDAIRALPLSKPMRWGDGDILFARPVHWAVLLLGDAVVAADILGVSTGRQSYGHRFHQPRPINIPTASAYEALLKDNFVIADFDVRRQMIIEAVQQLAADKGFVAVMPPALVDEVTSIVEWPQALLASFEEEFLGVPAEALIAAMQLHQKCFALRDKQGTLLPHFITVANIASKNTQQLVLGNEKVMRARLSDAAFFYRQDMRQSLSDYLPRTANVVFQANLGSLHDKMMRMKDLMAYLSSPLQLDKKHAIRAAELSKCDLMTGMVGEFPELQGVMGYYYARHDQEPLDVAEALNEQYMPRFSADRLPPSPLGQALSLADRMDTLVGTFAMGQKPTGVKDPFKLRRHALAVLRLLIATPAAINLSTLIDVSRHAYANTIKPIEGALAELKPFILDRLPSFYQAKGVSPELIQAVCARQDDWLFDLDNRVSALLAFVSLPAAGSLSAACKRVNNLLQSVSFSMDEPVVEVGLLQEVAEKTLFDSLQTVEALVIPLYSQGDYGSILTALAGLRTPVDDFFLHVMVMVDDAAIKNNRLNLLARLQRVLQGVADISLL